MQRPAWDKFWEKQRERILFALLCLVGSVALGRVAVIAQRLDPWQDFCVVFLFSLCLIWAAVATFVSQTHAAGAISGENIETRLNEWLLKFRFANQKLADSSVYRFAYRVTAPNGQAVTIGRPATLDNYLRYRTDLTTLQRHRRTLNDMGENGRRRFMIEYMAECSKARVHVISARALPLTVKLERTIPITRHLTADDLWAGLEAIQQDLAVALTHIDLCLERLRQAQNESQPVASAPAAPSGPEAESWTNTSLTADPTG